MEFNGELKILTDFPSYLRNNIANIFQFSRQNENGKKSNKTILVIFLLSVSRMTSIQLLQIAIHFIALGVELSDQREKKYWRVSSLQPFNRFLKTTRDTTKTGKFLISSAQQECNYINHLTVQSYLSLTYFVVFHLLLRVQF